MNRPQLAILLAGSFVVALLSCSSAILQPPTRTEIRLSKERWGEGDAGMGDAIKRITRYKYHTWTATSDAGISEPRQIALCSSTDIGYCYRPEYRSAEAYCRNLIIWGQGRYKTDAHWGAILATLGLAGTAASVTWSADGAKHDKALGYSIALATGTAVLTAFGAVLIKQAVNAAEAAGEASAAMNESTEEAQWKVCRTVAAKWLGANAESLKAIQDIQNELKTDIIDAGAPGNGDD